MRVRKLALTAAAAAMTVLPIAAHAAPVARAPAEVTAKDEKIVGLVWQYILLPIVIGAVIALITGGDDDDPKSP